MIDLRQALGEEVILGDGAMASHLAELGAELDRGPEALVLSRPELITQVHRAYLQAGAQLIETNSFGANPLRLARVGLEDRAEEINRTAVRLALAASAGKAWVAGSIGPPGPTRLDDSWHEPTVRAAVRLQAQALVAGGVQALLLETFSDLEVLLLALEEARAAAGSLPVIAQICCDHQGMMASGPHAAEAARRLVAAGAEVVGANCGWGLKTMRAAVEGLLAGAGGRPISAFPNAGFPERQADRLVYRMTASYFAQEILGLVKLGARVVGGCCGTDPETIQAIRLALAGRKGVAVVVPTRSEPAAPSATPTSVGTFLRSLTQPWPVIAELDPPTGLDCRPVLQGAEALAQAGAAAISLADNPLASLRMSPVAMGAILRARLPMQVVCHLTARDRNVLALQSEMLGAHAAGIGALLAVTGDPPGLAERGRGIGVYEVNGAGVVRLAASLNRGRTSQGRSLTKDGTGTDFSIGVAFNSAAAELRGELRRLGRKCDEGAHFVMTQPVFTRDDGRRILDHLRPCGRRLFLGFLPTISLRLAEHLHHEVPGMRLPESLLARLASLPQPADQEQAGLDHLADLLEGLRQDLDGLYLIAPGNRWRHLLGALGQITTWRKAPA